MLRSHRPIHDVDRPGPAGLEEPLPVLEAMPVPARNRLAAHLVRLTLEPGGIVMHEGELTPFLAIVVKGRVALRMRVPERGPITVLTLDPGDMVGWSALVPPYRSTTTATALQPTELAILEATDLRALLAADPEVAAGFLPAVLATVAARLDATRDQLLDLFRGSGVEPW